MVGALLGRAFSGIGIVAAAVTAAPSSDAPLACEVAGELGPLLGGVTREAGPLVGGVAGEVGPLLGGPTGEAGPLVGEVAGERSPFVGLDVDRAGPLLGTSGRVILAVNAVVDLVDDLRAVGGCRGRRGEGKPRTECSGGDRPPR